MNILDAYVKEYGFFHVVFSSLDQNLLSEIVVNLANDFKAEVLNIYSIMENIDDLDENRLQELFFAQNPVKFIIAPIFPTSFTKKKIKVSYHINISLNDKLKISKGIPMKLTDLENMYKDQSFINKYLNLAKFSSNHELENKIFDLLIDRINSKLDKGDYKNKLEEEEFSEKYVSKKYNHDKKEAFLERKNKHIDDEIMESTEDDSYLDSDSNSSETFIVSESDVSESESEESSDEKSSESEESSEEKTSESDESDEEDESESDESESDESESYESDEEDESESDESNEEDESESEEDEYESEEDESERIQNYEYDSDDSYNNIYDNLEGGFINGKRTLNTKKFVSGKREIKKWIKIPKK